MQIKLHVIYMKQQSVYQIFFQEFAFFFYRLAAVCRGFAKPKSYFVILNVYQMGYLLNGNRFRATHENMQTMFRTIIIDLLSTLHSNEANEKTHTSFCYFFFVHLTYSRSY